MGKIGNPSLIGFDRVDLPKICHAIIERASDDTRLLAKRGIVKGTIDRTGITVSIEEIEAFFQSDWYKFIIKEIASLYRR